MTERRKCVYLKLPLLGAIPLHPEDAYEELKVKEGPLWAQFFKYGLCGCLSACILFGVVYLFHFFAPDYMSESLPEEQRQLHMRIALFSAFVPSNLFAYFTNRWLVFSTGKYGFWMELAIFSGISLLSFIGGELGKIWMIQADFSNFAATFAFAFSSALVNFVARKFLVFAR